MKATPRLTLPAALTAAVLAITTLTPVAALEEAATTRSTTLSEERQGNLVSKVVESDGEIVSTLVDATTGEAVLPDPARARTSGGTGLGLSISLEDAHLHGGWLQAWGRPGEGAQFRLTLPRKVGDVLRQSPLPLVPADAPEPVG